MTRHMGMADICITGGSDWTLRKISLLWGYQNTGTGRIMTFIRASLVPAQFAVRVRLCLKPWSLLRLWGHGSYASEIIICDMKGTFTTWLLMWGNWRLRSRWTSLPLHLIPPTPLNKLLQIADMLYCSVTLALCSMVLLLWVAVRCGYVHRPAVFFCQNDGLTFSSVKLHCFTNVYLSHLI